MNPAKSITARDIYSTTEDNLSNTLGDLLEKNWRREVEMTKNTTKMPSLKRALFETFWKSYGKYGVHVFINGFMRTLHPLLLARYIRYFEEDTLFYDIGPFTFSKKAYGWIIGVILVLLSFIYVIVFHYISIGVQRIGMRVRIACCSLLYRKVLKLSHTALRETAAGQVVNLMSNDVIRFNMASHFLHYVWFMPFQFLGSLYILHRIVGVSAYAGMIGMIINALPLQACLSYYQGKQRMKTAQRTDNRIKFMSELISGMLVIKMYAWEKPFEKMVATARKYEIKSITRISYIKGLSAALGLLTERFTLYLTLMVYVMMGNTLGSETIFCVAQLFVVTTLFVSVYFPFGIAAYAEANATMDRLNEFLNLDENVRGMLEQQIDDGSKVGSIELRNVSASWSSHGGSNSLSDINLHIPQGYLCCIIGNVGCGKSSLLRLLLGEMCLNKGEKIVSGKISYSSQEPWLFISSIRNNILFGKPYDDKRYRNAIEACALEEDFEQFPYKDKTLVGEKGHSLSGGQRSRMNLARSVYADADIYLFDDPLSAVDPEVARHLFQKCIKNYLAGKTRVLVTHQRQFLEEADMVIVMDDGKIDVVGSFDQLPIEVLVDIDNQYEMERRHEHKFDETKSKLELGMIEELGYESDDEEPPEFIPKGAMKSVYWEYFRTGTNIWVLGFFLMIFVLAQIATNASDIWMTKWTNDEVGKVINHSSDSTIDLKIGYTSQEYYMYVYSFLVIGSIILTTIRSLFFYKIAMNTSTGLHNDMFANIVKAPMWFFDKNPLGRILNRFSKDIGLVDEYIPFLMLEAIQAILLMIGILSVIFLVTPLMIVPAMMLGAVFHYFNNMFLHKVRDLTRLEGVAKGPMLSHLTDTFGGLSTIRSLGAERIVIEEFDVLQDQHTAMYYMLIVCSEALGFYLDCLTTVFLAFATFQFLFSDYAQIASSDVGLVVSTCLVLSGMLQLGIRLGAELAAYMTCVERIIQYSNIEKEIDLYPDAMMKPKNWPLSGNISFHHVSLRYGPNDLPVLRDVDFVIESGQKIGIVGRTGAGKSSLISSLFRLAFIEGTISIDEIDTAKVDLEYLRSNISVIPQEPVLFSASIRYNIDPFNKVEDDVIWKAISDVELKSSIDSLDQEVCGGGANFSVGQRQLLCLARAIIRNNKILVMDEATANVDNNTDALIQKTVRTNFRYCTVLTIAHRLDTIIDCDKVLVMAGGKVIEFASPQELLLDPDGHFYQMVEKSGSAAAARLRGASENETFG